MLDDKIGNENCNSLKVLINIVIIIIEYVCCFNYYNNIIKDKKGIFGE